MNSLSNKDIYVNTELPKPDTIPPHSPILIPWKKSFGDPDFSAIMHLMSDFIVVLVTCGSEEEALKIANALVEERLAACANIISSVRSIYRWEGKICDEKEWVLLIKTQRESFEALEKKVKSLHSYSVPEIIGLPILESSEAYLEWIREMTCLNSKH
jgi:periplasmic divalent cation tolerance protein